MTQRTHAFSVVVKYNDGVEQFYRCVRVVPQADWMELHTVPHPTSGLNKIVYVPSKDVKAVVVEGA